MTKTWREEFEKLFEDALKADWVAVRIEDRNCFWLYYTATKIWFAKKLFKDFIETQISLAREEWRQELLKELPSFPNLMDYNKGKEDGRAEMKAQCLAVIEPNDTMFLTDNMIKWKNWAKDEIRNSISSL